MNRANIRNFGIVGIFLATHLNTISMENPQLQLQNPKNSRPLIKAIVYFHPTRPAFYASNDQLAHLNKKGIASPILPIMREVAEVKVLESGGSVTNWLQNPTKQIKAYETSLLKTQQLSFGEKLQKNLAIQNKTFPHFLPVELSCNCSHLSKINLTIDEFPVRVTFASKADFITEQNNCMATFYEHPSAGSFSQEIEKLIAEHKINIISTEISPLIIYNSEPTIIIKHNTSHADKIYTSEKSCYKEIINNKIKPHTTITQFLRNRETGTSFRRPLNIEQNLDIILSNCLNEIEFNTPQNSP